MESSQQRKAKEKVNSFWNWKRILLISITFAITIGLIAWAIISISKPQFSWSGIRSSIDNNPGLWAGMLLVLLSWMFFNYLYRIFPLILRLKALGIKISWKEQIIFVMSVTFMNAITPGALVTEPYTVFWLKTKGVSTAKASAIIWINDFMWHIISVCIAIPSFIILCTNDELMDALLHTGEGRMFFIFICIGLGLDVLLFALYIFMGSSKHFHYALSRVFNTFKRWFKMSYHTKPQTRQTYLVQATLQREAKLLLLDWKKTLATLIINGMFQIVIYSSLFASLTMVDTTISNGTNFAHIFNVANVVMVANKYLPIPNGEGLVQLEMKYLLNNITTPPPINDPNTVMNGIFVWRSFTTYLPAIIGLVGFIIFVVGCIKSVKGHKKLIKKAVR